MNKEKGLSRRTDVLLESARILPAIRGILPRTQRGGFVGTQVESSFSPGERASGNMPDRASRMLALPIAARRAGFQRGIVITLFCALYPLIAFAEPNVEFAKANQEYAQGNFKEAIAGYEALVHADQWNANLFYDLGNAYF